MNTLLRTALVVACLFQPLAAVSAQASGLSPDQYVRALTQHLQGGGDLDAAAEQNVRQLVTAEQNRVNQEAFVQLGNELYRSGHGDLADQVMQSKTVAPSQYEGAELRVMWPNAESQ